MSDTPTPGPWKKRSRGFNREYDIEGPDGVDLNQDCIRGMVYGEANANLIAAAPCLLAAIHPVAAAIRHTEDGVRDFPESDWNPESHVEITLTVAECRAVLKAVKAVTP